MLNYAGAADDPPATGGGGGGGALPASCFPFAAAVDDYPAVSLFYEAS